MRANEELEGFCTVSYPELMGMLSLYCGDPLLAEEVAQEALARICRDWRRVRAMDRPDAWVRRIALNLVRSHFRRKKAEHRAQQRIALGRPQGIETSNELRIVVSTAISQLPSRERAALVLRYYSDMTVPDVAWVLDVPEGTAKSLLHRGKKRLQKRLADLEPKEGVANAG